MRGSITVLVCIVMLGLLASPGDALALRCGGSLVSVGDVRLEVAAKCGEPSEKTLYYEERKIGRSTRIVPVEVWIYNFGPQRFVYFLTFEKGKLVETRTGGYGY
jgi:hypothetical protein